MSTLEPAVEFDNSLRAQVEREINDPRYTSRHGSSKCYQKGCRGPLCKLTERKRQRARHGFKARFPEYDTFVEELYQEYLGSINQEEVA